MHNTALCTVQHCDTPTQQYLCHDCTTELQEAWDKIPDLIPVLQLITRGEEKPFYQPTAGGRSGATGSKAPINLSALSLAQNLQLARMCTPRQYATQSDAWRAYAQILQWVSDADLMVNGEQENTESKKNAAKYRLKIAPVLSPAEMVAWFASKDGPRIEITEDQLKNWKYQGRLHPANSQGRPKYHAADVYLAYQNAGRPGWRPAQQHGNQHYVEPEENENQERSPKLQKA